MTLKNIETKKGETVQIELLVVGVETALSKYHDLYTKYHVLDAEGRSAKLFSFKDNITVQKGDVGIWTIYVKEYNDTISLNAVDFKKSDNPKDRADFFPAAHVKPEESWRIINQYFKQIRQPGLHEMVKTGLMENRDGLIHRPMQAEGAFARESGILEATEKLVSTAVPIAQSFKLNTDLTISCGLLYYIGNIDMVTDGYQETVEDALFGAGLTTVRKMTLIETALRQDNKLTDETFPKEISNGFYHCLASRQGSIRSAIPEAVLLRNADTMIRQIDDSLWLLGDLTQGQIVTVNTKQKYVHL